MNLKKKKIAVLMGGRSGEREVSLRSGKRVFESLKKQGYNVISLDTGPDLINKLKKGKVDVVFIMLHGRFGEDGTIQGLLEMHGIPYTGSKVLASAIGMNKIASKRIWASFGIPTPKFTEINPENISKEIDKVKKCFPFPVVVKPVSEGSSLGVTIVREADKLDDVIKKTVKEFNDVFVEEFIAGQEVTVGILGVDSGLQALPILELVPKSDFYDYKAKYTAGMTEFVIPARLSKPVSEHVQSIALEAHRAVGAYGFSRVDIIVSRDHVPYVHDINTIPGMTERSDLPAEAAHAGISFDQLVVKILESAR
jgi:D-alanine-D-alanine ligase